MAVRMAPQRFAITQTLSFVENTFSLKDKDGYLRRYSNLCTVRCYFYCTFFAILQYMQSFPLSLFLDMITKQKSWVVLWVIMLVFAVTMVRVPVVHANSFGVEARVLQTIFNTPSLLEPETVGHIDQFQQVYSAEDATLYSIIRTKDMAYVYIVLGVLFVALAHIIILLYRHMNKRPIVSFCALYLENSTRT